MGQRQDCWQLLEGVASTPQVCRAAFVPASWLATALLVPCPTIQVANSWNPYWGEKGFFRIAFGEGGIDDQVIASAKNAKWAKKSA